MSRDKFITSWLVLMALIGALAIVALNAEAQVRIDVAEKGITITAVEFTVERKECEVDYFHPGDVNQDGTIETCNGLEYDFCDAGAGQREIIQHVLGGDECTDTRCGIPPNPPNC